MIECIIKKNNLISKIIKLIKPTFGITLNYKQIMIILLRHQRHSKMIVVWYSTQQKLKQLIAGGDFLIMSCDMLNRSCIVRE